MWLCRAFRVWPELFSSQQETPYCGVFLDIEGRDGRTTPFRPPAT